MKIATVGTGIIVEKFLSALKEVKNAECVAIYSRKEEKARTLSQKFNVNKIYTDYSALLKDENIDFIYIALPNSLHYEYAKLALQNNKNVICEKPFTSTILEAEELITLAKEKNLFLFEAITTLHLSNYKIIKNNLGLIGKIKLIQCNYSQYSSRYDNLLNGEVTNIFNPAFSGGALVDINIYNFHFAAGLFGKAGKVKYAANYAQNGIDTSGTATLIYDDFICECTGAKDSQSPGFAIIQGTDGYIKVNSSPNECLSFEIVNKTKTETINENKFVNNMVSEIADFETIYNNKDFKACHELLKHSLNVVEMSVMARNDAEIVFDADKE